MNDVGCSQITSHSEEGGQLRVTTFEENRAIPKAGDIN